jgi:hypothetical protein
MKIPAAFSAILACALPMTVLSAEVLRVVDVAPVWAAHPVGFFLLTHGDRQYTAFYDADRHLTVGVRTLEDDRFELVRLPEQTKWDSHNYITMTVDDDGYLHLSGNMHNVPLIYFRTEAPGDITRFTRIESMVGREESRVTYPRFFRGPANELIFTYRQGGSGNGEQIYNRYDHETKTWSRLLDQPLVSGEGEKNAYFHGPVRGPDRFFHLVWVWRDTPDCSTNHHVSYARSRDLVHWETSDGKRLELPITFATGEVVDAVPPRGGLINGNAVIGFDSKHRPIISYHKFDDEGNTQLYNARLENGGWRIHQTSNWDYRWWFEGGGSIVFEIRVGNIRREREPGRLTQTFDHVKYGNRQWVLDEDTLQPIEERDAPRQRPEQLEEVQSDFPGMEVRWAGDAGSLPARGVRHWLRWETLPHNRDRPRQGLLPDPVMLRLYEISNWDHSASL